MKRFVWPAFACLLLLAGVDTYAQQPMQRVYADAQTNNDCALCLTIDVDNPSQAVDGDVSTHSSMTITVLGEVYQQLSFTGEQPQEDDPLHLKIGTSTGLLNLLNGLVVQAYDDNMPVGASHTAESLLGLLDGADQGELVLPAPGVPYDGVRISYDGVALGGSFNIYEAYFYKPVVGPVACNMPADALWGSDGSLVGGLNGVEDALNAIDGDPSTAALLRSNVGALNEVHLTVLYNTLFPAGDSIRFTLQGQDGGLLDAGLLSTAFHLRAYNNNTLVTEVDGNSGLLRLKLLPGSGNSYYFTIPVSAPFNRAEIAISSGLVGGALEGMYLYEAEPMAPDPVVAGLTDGMLALCEGVDATLTISSPETGATYRWYADSTSTTPLGTGTSFDLPALAAGTEDFFVSYSRNNCTDESSARAKVTVVVNPTAVAADITLDDATTCEGSPVVLSPASTLTNPVYKWYKDANKAQPITDGTTEGVVSYAIDASGALTVTGLAAGAGATYYVSVEGDEKCENAAGALKAVNVTVTAPPDLPSIILTPALNQTQ